MIFSEGKAQKHPPLLIQIAYLTDFHIAGFKLKRTQDPQISTMLKNVVPSFILYVYNSLLFKTFQV